MSKDLYGAKMLKRGHQYFPGMLSSTIKDWCPRYEGLVCSKLVGRMSTSWYLWDLVNVTGGDDEFRGIFWVVYGRCICFMSVISNHNWHKGTIIYGTITVASPALKSHDCIALSVASLLNMLSEINLYISGSLAKDTQDCLWL